MSQITPSKRGFYKLVENAIIPTKGTPRSAGWDLYSPDEYTISPGESVIVMTGIGVVIPEGYSGRIAPRSGWSVKGLFLNGGVVDIDYELGLGVICFNFSKQNIIIKRGDRIAQFLLEKIFYGDMPEISQPEPGERCSHEPVHAGFGSTGN